MYALLHKSGRIAPVTGVLATRQAANTAARHFAMTKGITLAVIAHPGVLTAVQAGHTPQIVADVVAIEEAGVAAAEARAENQGVGCGCEQDDCQECAYYA